MARRINLSVLAKVYVGLRLFEATLEKIIRYFGYLTRPEAGVERTILQVEVQKIFKLIGGSD